MALPKGIVHWSPPPAALTKAAELIKHQPHMLSQYGAGEGLPELRTALKSKIATRNNLIKHNIMVTAGANQAFVNVVLTLLDEGEQVVLFKPYYFNHHMAVQMTRGQDSVVLGLCDPHTLHPSAEWLEERMAQPKPPKMVVIVNPCNPTGVLLGQEEMQRISDVCSRGGAWLVLDNTYEDFVFGDTPQPCVPGPHVVHIFSFSKAFGLMGWRCGYIAYPDYDGKDTLGAMLLKAQDTIAICASQLSQEMALVSMRDGGQYVADHIKALEANRQCLLDALTPLGQLGDGNVAGGEGAIYVWARLPDGCDDDFAVVQWLVREAGVCVVPGSSCGAPGFVRCAFANLAPDTYQEAASRLKAGLQKLVQHGFSIVKESS